MSLSPNRLLDTSKVYLPEGLGSALKLVSLKGTSRVLYIKTVDPNALPTVYFFQDRFERWTGKVRLSQFNSVLALEAP